MENEGYWPLHKRVDEFLHTLVTIHRKCPTRSTPEFHAYKGASDQFDWLEHPGIERHKNRMPVQMEDVGILRTRKMVDVIRDGRDDKLFNLTAAGLQYHDEHCTREKH